MTALKLLTAEDIDMIVYVIQQKDDVTRWCDWESKAGHVQVELPNLWRALEARKAADRLLHLELCALQDGRE